MKSQLSARLRSIGCGLQVLVFRVSSARTCPACLASISSLRAWQLATACRPFLVRRSLIFLVALRWASRTFFGWASLRSSCWSKVVEWALTLTVVLPFFSALTLTSIECLRRILFCPSLRIFRLTFFFAAAESAPTTAVPANATAAATTNTTTASFEVPVKSLSSYTLARSRLPPRREVPQTPACRGPTISPLAPRQSAGPPAASPGL